MRVLVVGAGATGGYFGGRLLAAGRNVTFLVRPARAAQLKQDGLNIKSPTGDLHIPDPPTVTASHPGGPYDLVLLSCKAYDLDASMRDIAGAVGPNTAILPLLNGMQHLDGLAARFGATHVLGGVCQVASTLDAAGTIVHLTPMHGLIFGERDGAMSPRVGAIAELMRGAGFDFTASPTIILDMWEKWVFLATLAGITCLMRAPIGEIIAAGGLGLIEALLAATKATAEAEGFAPRPAYLERVGGMLTSPGSPMTASMLRDIERGGAIEAEHVLGDLLSRHDAHGLPESAILRAAYVHAATYERRRIQKGR